MPGPSLLERVRSAAPGGALLDSALSAVSAPVEGNVRMAAAMARDVAGALDPLGVTGGGERPADPLDARDPEYIRRTLPALRLTSALYHRAEVTGLERIPADGPILLVGNHSGGTLIVDTFVFAQAFYDHFGPDRRFHQLAHDLVFRVPGPRVSLSRYGTIPASPENMRRAIERGAALLVYPGGDHETYRPSWESARVDFAGRRSPTACSARSTASPRSGPSRCWADPQRYGRSRTGSVLSWLMNGDSA